MLKGRKIELRVGIFVFVAMIILVMFIFLISDFRFFKQGYYVKLIFGFASGVKIGAPVRLAGVDVGEVKTIRIFRKPQMDKAKVEISVWLKKEAIIPQDSRVQINTLGLLGEKYVEIIPGSDYSSLVGEGNILIGEDPISMQELSSFGKDIALKLDQAISGLNKIVADEEFQVSLKDTIENLEQASNSLNLILGRIEKGEGSVGKLINDDTLYKSSEEPPLRFRSR